MPRLWIFNTWIVDLPFQYIGTVHPEINTASVHQPLVHANKTIHNAVQIPNDMCLWYTSSVIQCLFIYFCNKLYMQDQHTTSPHLASLGGSILRILSRYVFLKIHHCSADIMTQLTCVSLLHCALWTEILFIPQAVRLVRIKSYALQTFFWVAAQVISCMFILLSHSLSTATQLWIEKKNVDALW